MAKFRKRKMLQKKINRDIHKFNRVLKNLLESNRFFVKQIDCSYFNEFSFYKKSTMIVDIAVIDEEVGLIYHEWVLYNEDFLNALVSIFMEAIEEYTITIK